MQNWTNLRIFLEALLLLLDFDPRLIKTRVQLAASVYNKSPITGKLSRHTSEKNIWIFDSYIPKATKDSGSRRILEIISILNLMGFKVYFTPTLGGYSHQIGRLDIEGAQIVSLKDGFGKLAKTETIFWICRFPNARFLFKKLKRMMPRSKFIFDTVDLHGLRISRNGTSAGLGLVTRMGLAILKKEVQLGSKFDKTVVVSNVESALLSDSGVSSCVISNIHELRKNPNRWQDRTGQIFVGNFHHTPNVIGLAWYLTEVWPKLPIEVQTQGLKIIGVPVPNLQLPRFSENIEFLGHVDNLEDLLQGARISIAPLISGAGAKGKVGESFGMGVPVVLTKIAAEGMNITNTVPWLITDNSSEFAELVVRLQTDKKLNYQASQAGFKLVEEHFSQTSAAKGLVKLLA